MAKRSKRNLIPSAVKVQSCLKGTRRPLITRALGGGCIEGSVSEWFEHDGAPAYVRSIALIDERCLPPVSRSAPVVAEV